MKQFIGQKESLFRKFLSEAICNIRANQGEDIEITIDRFLRDIKLYDVDVKMKGRVKEAFKAAYEVKRINYENILLEMKKEIPNIKEEKLKEDIQVTYITWLCEFYPEIYYSIEQKGNSIMPLLKLFVKIVNGEE